jgi:hypothetical protein
MPDGVEQTADGVTCGSSTKIVGSDVQIDLGAGDQPVTEQIANGDQLSARTRWVAKVCRMRCGERGMPTRLRCPQVRTRS